MVEITITFAPSLDLSDRTLRRILKYMLRKLERYTPVDSGDLRRAWHGWIEGNTIVIVNRLPYAAVYDSLTGRPTKNPRRGRMSSKAWRDTLIFLNRAYREDRLAQMVQFEVKYGY